MALVPAQSPVNFPGGPPVHDMLSVDADDLPSSSEQLRHDMTIRSATLTGDRLPQLPQLDVHACCL